MNDIIAVPTVEQINLEHQLANSKASEAVQHATNCGLMLLQVKASLSHGEWLPWLKQQQESGAILFTERTASKYMRIASNRNHGSDLPEAPSIRAALELLSDKEPDDEQLDLIPADIEAERQARIAAEQKAEEEQRRSMEWRDQWKEKRDLAEKALGDLAAVADEKDRLQIHVAALERRIDDCSTQPAPEPEKVEVAPADYESTKKKAGELQAQTEALQKQLDSLKKQQAKLVKDQVAAKLHERQVELDKLEADKQAIEEVVARKKAYLDSLDSEVKRIETHRSVIDGCRLELISLAAFLNDLDPISDPDTIKRWLALADMLADASQSIRMVFEPSRTDLRIAA